MAFLWASSRVIAGIMIVCWAAFIVSMIIDRRKYSNIIFLAVAILSSLWLLSVIGDKVLGSICYILIFLIFSVFPAHLVRNGIVSGEKRTFKEFLSLIGGILLLILEVAALIVALFVDVSFQLFKASTVILFLSTIIIYISILFAAFVLFAKLAHSIPKKKDFDYLIIEGNNLSLDGSMSDMLKTRLDKAAEVYLADETHPMVIISSGNRRRDSVAETGAAAKYLESKGVNEEDIKKELLATSFSTGVEECANIINRREGRKYTAFVTDDYGVLRALITSRKKGLSVTGIGATVPKNMRAASSIEGFFIAHADPKRLALSVAGWAVFAVIALVLL